MTRIYSSKGSRSGKSEKLSQTEGDEGTQQLRTIHGLEQGLLL